MLTSSSSEAAAHLVKIKVENFPPPPSPPPPPSELMR
jgi:hypothetical protein